MHLNNFLINTNEVESEPKSFYVKTRMKKTKTNQTLALNLSHHQQITCHIDVSNIVCHKLIYLLLKTEKKKKKNLAVHKSLEFRFN